MRNAILLVSVAILSSFITIIVSKELLYQPVMVKEVIPSVSDDLSVNVSHAQPLIIRNFRNAAQKASPAAVYVKSKIRSDMDAWEYIRESTTGSGVIISEDGYIVTNNHVIEKGADIEVVLNDRREYKADIIGVDPNTDLALLKIDAAALQPIKFGNSDLVEVGDWVLAVGNPFKLQSTITAGIISAKGRNIDVMRLPYGIESFIQTDAAVNPGNSGGALVNTEGELIGINTAILTESGFYEGYSFAIPGNIVLKVISDIKEFGAVHRGLLGITVKNIDSDIARRLKMKSVEGAYVESVTAHGGSQDAGIRAGDVIVQVDEIEVKSKASLLEYIGQHRPGDEIEINYLRHGNLYKTTVTLKNQLNTTELVSIRRDQVLKDVGIEVRELIKGEKQRLGKTGVRVVSIYRDSPVGRTHMEPGFIITAMNEEKIEGVEQFIQNLNKAEGKIILEGLYEKHGGPWWYAFEK